MLRVRRWGATGREIVFRSALYLVVLSAAVVTASCGPAPDAPEAGSELPVISHPITLGDVEEKEPLRRIRWIQPLADHLAEQLAPQGIDGGRVIVARDLDEMGRLLAEGRVDLYLDSPLATMQVVEASRATVLLRRWVRDQPSYWSLFLTYQDSGLEGPADLNGRTIAFQERHSTTGFLLPALALLERGLHLRTVSAPDAQLPKGQIGCFFSGDEENSVEMLVGKTVVAAVVSNQDYDELPEEIRQSLRILDSTPSVPRQLVSVRPGMDAASVEEIRRVLLAITDEDRRRLADQEGGEGWTWRFDELPPTTLSRLRSYAERLDDLALD